MNDGGFLADIHARLTTIENHLGLRKIHEAQPPEIKAEGGLSANAGVQKNDWLHKFLEKAQPLSDLLKEEIDIPSRQHAILILFNSLLTQALSTLPDPVTDEFAKRMPDALIANIQSYREARKPKAESGGIGTFVVDDTQVTVLRAGEGPHPGPPIDNPPGIPNGYEQIPEGAVVCRCIDMKIDSHSRFWCCGRPQGEGAIKWKPKQ